MPMNNVSCGSAQETRSKTWIHTLDEELVSLWIVELAARDRNDWEILSIGSDGADNNSEARLCEQISQHCAVSS